MSVTGAQFNRRLHRIAALLSAAPLLLVVLTGLLLQLKKNSSWIQPSTQIGSGTTPTLSFPEILDAAKGVEEAQVQSWNDIDRLDVRPSKGIVKVRAKSSWEVQLDNTSGEVLQVAYRRSDLIESLHDGSWFHKGAKLWVFLPSGFLLLGLWVSGVYLWLLPHLMRRQKKRRLA